MTTYTGSCHCGAVSFTVVADITSGLKCNCSHCSRKGFLLAFVPESQFTLTRGEENLTLYQFNKKHIDHLFCKTCGVQCFGRGKDKEGNATYAINLNCLENFDIESIEVQPYNGKDV